MFYRNKETKEKFRLLSKKSKDMARMIDIAMEAWSGGEVKVEYVLCGPGSEEGKGWELIKLSIERMEHKKMETMIEVIGQIFTIERGESVRPRAEEDGVSIILTIRTEE